MTSPTLSAVRADITTLETDAVVNAANTRMRGGGGVDGAIHRAAGPELLAECVERFPNGLATGDAGWTHGWNLPARWIVHTVGPDARAGQTDPALLASCYRRSLEVADELGARSIAFPLVGAGVYGWAPRTSADLAVRAVRETPTRLERVLLVAFSDDALEAVEAALAAA